MVKKYPIVAGLIILLILLAGFWYFKSPTNIPDPDLKTYRNDKFGFEFKYFNDPVYNLIVQENGSENRDPIARLDQMCLIRNSVKYRNRVGVGNSLCLTIYNSDTDKNFVFPWQYLKSGNAKAIVINSKTIDVSGQNDVVYEEFTNDYTNKINQIGLNFIKENNLYIITSIVATDNDLAIKNSKEDLDLFIKTFRFTK